MIELSTLEGARSVAFVFNVVFQALDPYRTCLLRAQVRSYGQHSARSRYSSRTETRLNLQVVPAPCEGYHRAGQSV